MAFGNMGDDSGTGVAFTRNPATGEKKLFGEFLINAQGEDVVAGVRTPMPIAEMAEKYPRGLRAVRRTSATPLENHYRDMQDMEFTIEDGKLYMLQTRNGKRTAAAALKIACDLVDEGMIDREGGRRHDRARSSSGHAAASRSLTPTALKKAAVIGKGSGRLSRRGLRQGRLLPPRTPRRGRQERREGRPGPSGDHLPRTSRA